MNKKSLITLLLILISCITFIKSTGCQGPDDPKLPELTISINNDSVSTLKHIYWVSDAYSGVLDIDVPPDTDETIVIDNLPGLTFQFMITTDNTDEYVKWIDVESPQSEDIYLTSVGFNAKLFDSCYLLATFQDAYYASNCEFTVFDTHSVENTLPSTK